MRLTSDSRAISPAYAAQNRRLHETRDDYGRSSKMWADYVSKLVADEGYKSVLDYGCGKGELKARLPELPIAEYDPAIPGKTHRPKPAELVICTDVMEHIEPDKLDFVIRDLKRVTERKLFCVVCVVPSSKSLDDGRNAHLIVETPKWWTDKLGEHFGIIRASQIPHLGVVAIEAFPLKLSNSKPEIPSGLRKRRMVTPEWLAIFAQIKEHSAKYQDAFSRINTIEMFEDMAGDKPADLQALVNMLPEVPDPEAVLRKAIKIAHKGVLVAQPITADKDEAYWRALLEKHLRIADWTCAQGGMICIGSPMVSVQGVTAVGVMDTDLRWEQVKEATARIHKRIRPYAAHNHTAIIACYGPSLQKTIEELKAEAQGGDKVVVSVSGAHDFLVENGITPDYHVECDPRAHKADNIDKAVAGCQYLIASVCHQAMFDKLAGGDIALWHVSTPEHALRLIDELGQHRDHVIGGGGSVGLRAIPLLYSMGFRKFSIYGMDCSFSDDGEMQWAGKHAGKRQDLCQVDVAGRIFTTSPILMTYATNFFETIQKVPDCHYRLVGNGLLQAMAHYYSQLEKEAA